MTPVTAPKVSRLAKARRWENTTKMTQSVHDYVKNEFIRIPANGCIEGAQFSHTCKPPNFREVLNHIQPKDLKPMIGEETDIDMLVHLSNIERYSSDPRESVLAAFSSRIKKLRKDEEDGEEKKLEKNEKKSGNEQGQPDGAQS